MLEVHVKIFKLFGIIRSGKLWNSWCGIVHFVSLMLLTSLMSTEMLMVGVNLEKLSAVFEILFVAIAADIVIVITYWKQDTVNEMLEYMGQHQHKIDQTYTNLCRKITKYYSYLIGITVMMYSMKPFVTLLQSSEPINVSKPLIYPTTIPFETNLLSYSAIYLWQFYTGLFGCLILNNWHTFVVSMMIFVISQLRYVHLCVRNAPESPSYKQHLIGVIQHHQNTVRYVSKAGILVVTPESTELKIFLTFGFDLGLGLDQKSC